LNTSYAKEGAFVYIPKKTVAEKPNWNYSFFFWWSRFTLASTSKFDCYWQKFSGTNYWASSKS
jgi:hypothetical protein